jgi:hypothetical protein
MKLKSTKVAVPNGVLFITDVSGGKTPQPVRGASFLSTPSCIAFTCRIDSEGETEISIGAATDLNLSRLPEFDGAIKTPNGALAISMVGGKKVLEMAGLPTEIRVRIWSNHPSQANKVLIGLG